MSLCDKAVLVTGACSGIGYAIAQELLKNNLKTLVVLDIHSKPECIDNWKEQYPKISIKYFMVNVAVDEEIKQCYEAIAKDLGTLDIVINCAGILDESDYVKMINVNLGGVIGSTFRAIENMRKDVKGHGGVIVNISSILGLDPASVIPTYSATKHAIIAFHRSVSFGNDNMGIKFICICPGFTATPLYKNARKPGFYFNFGEEKLKMMKDANIKKQTPEVIAVGLVRLLDEAKNGSVWVIEDSEWREQTFPKLKY
ncbi:development-specific 25 kDa protein-like [Phlebotomus papatasi]|uniref:development-specific 25 kDa protein-like n=1 Tax=Phlebotomus papatasi TaxID=29031 RepID=UPI002483523F|nr:development-specific 25 kDa protein-like [Phlebotomus papatasi]